MTVRVSSLIQVSTAGPLAARSCDSHIQLHSLRSFSTEGHLVSLGARSMLYCFGHAVLVQSRCYMVNGMTQDTKAQRLAVDCDATSSDGDGGDSCLAPCTKFE